MQKHVQLTNELESQAVVRDEKVTESLRLLWSHEGQDIAEYAVVLAVILVIVVGTIRLVGRHANRVFSDVASSIQ